MSSAQPSSSDELLYFLGVGRLARDAQTGQFQASQHQLLTCASSTHSTQQQRDSYRSHCEAIMTKGAAKLSIGKRIRLTPDAATYDLHVLCDELTDSSSQPPVLLVYFGISHTDFDRHHSISALFRSLQQSLLDESSITIFDLETCTALGKVHVATQSLLSRLLTQYNNNLANAKLRQVQGQVDEVKNQMAQNITHTLSNMSSLETIESKSLDFEQRAKQFQQGSTKVKSMMRRKYYLWTCIVGCFVIGILALIIWYVTKK